MAEELAETQHSFVCKEQRAGSNQRHQTTALLSPLSPSPSRAAAASGSSPRLRHPRAAPSRPPPQSPPRRPLLVLFSVLLPPPTSSRLSDLRPRTPNPPPLLLLRPAPSCVLPFVAAPSRCRKFAPGGRGRSAPDPLVMDGWTRVSCRRRRVPPLSPARGILGPGRCCAPALDLISLPLPDCLLHLCFVLWFADGLAGGGRVA